MRKKTASNAHQDTHHRVGDNDGTTLLQLIAVLWSLSYCSDWFIHSARSREEDRVDYVAITHIGKEDDWFIRKEVIILAFGGDDCYCMWKRRSNEQETTLQKTTHESSSVRKICGGADDVVRRMRDSDVGCCWFDTIGALLHLTTHQSYQSKSTSYLMTQRSPSLLLSTERNVKEHTHTHAGGSLFAGSMPSQKMYSVWNYNTGTANRTCCIGYCTSIHPH